MSERIIRSGSSRGVGAKQKFRPRINLIFILVNLTVLLVPLSGYYFLDIYKTVLVQQAEKELTIQALSVANSFKVIFRHHQENALIQSPEASQVSELRWCATPRTVFELTYQEAIAHCSNQGIAFASKDEAVAEYERLQDKSDSKNLSPLECPPGQELHDRSGECRQTIGTIGRGKLHPEAIWCVTVDWVWWTRKSTCTDQGGMGYASEYQARLQKTRLQKSSNYPTPASDFDDLWCVTRQQVWSFSNRLEKIEFCNDQGGRIYSSKQMADAEFNRIIESNWTRQADRTLAETIGKEIETILLESRDLTTVKVNILDFDGLVVASTEELHGSSFAHIDEVERSLLGNRVAYTNPDVEPELKLYDSKLEVFVNIPIELDNRILGVVVLSKTPSSISEILLNNRMLVLLILTIFLIYIVFISFFTAHTITKPIYSLVALVRNASQDNDVIKPLKNPRTREIDELSKSFTAMARRLNQRADVIRNFVSFISHELKTPLTSISGAIELMKSEGENLSTKDKNRFLLNIDKDTERLIALSHLFTELSHEEQLRAVGDTTHVLIEDALKKTEDDYALASLEVIVDDSVQDGMARLSESQFRLVLTSLIDNARKHRGSDVHIQIHARVNHESNLLEIQIENDGPPIPHDIGAYVFQPGFTTSPESDSDGLGLSIVQAHLKSHGGDISLLPNTDKVAFRLTIPVVTPFETNTT